MPASFRSRFRILTSSTGTVKSRSVATFPVARTHSISDVVGQVKRGSSEWLKTQGPRYANFHWQNGYGAFSVSPSSVDAVRRYIVDQRDHHAKTTFQDEFRAFLLRHGVEFDERYVWD